MQIQKFGFNCQMRNEPILIVICHSSLVKGAMNAARMSLISTGSISLDRTFKYANLKSSTFAEGPQIPNPQICGFGICGTCTFSKNLIASRRFDSFLFDKKLKHPAPS